MIPLKSTSTSSPTNYLHCPSQAGKRDCCWRTVSGSRLKSTREMNLALGSDDDGRNAAAARLEAFFWVGYLRASMCCCRYELWCDAPRSRWVEVAWRRRGGDNRSKQKFVFLKGVDGGAAGRSWSTYANNSTDARPVAWRLDRSRRVEKCNGSQC